MTQDKQRIGSATGTAQAIRSAIRAETDLTASAGVSYNKFLAKVASDQNKPDGIFVVRPHEGARFAASLPVRRFYGVGPKTAGKLLNQFGCGCGASTAVVSRLLRGAEITGVELDGPSLDVSRFIKAGL